MQISTFLTFVGDQCGKAEDALNFYTAIFPNSEIKSIVKYSEGEPGGTPELIKFGVFTLNGLAYKVSESNYNHAWSFNPGVSLFVECDSEKEIDTLFKELSSNGGQVMVPLDNYAGEGDYGFGKKFGWCEDQYGISWQLNLTE
jgi:predicted 3-demethylubiquinone-9 3-methyltransferase (glyoxalase superfamily)